MTKLSTPYHECATVYVDEYGAPVFRDGRRYHCRRRAYRRGPDGRWYCRSCLHSARRRAGEL
jgi:hypothetical protein